MGEYQIKILVLTLKAGNYVLKVWMLIIECYKNIISSNSLIIIKSWMDKHCCFFFVFFMRFSFLQRGIHLLSWSHADISWNHAAGNDWNEFQHDDQISTSWEHWGHMYHELRGDAPAFLNLETVCPDWARQKGQQLHTTVLSGIKNETPSWNAQECLDPKGLKESCM